MKEKKVVLTFEDIVTVKMKLEMEISQMQKEIEILNSSDYFEVSDDVKKGLEENIKRIGKLIDKFDILLLKDEIEINL